MPLPNRVDPFGELFATPARGDLMGNRGGRFHRDDRTLGQQRAVSRRWICCVTAFKDRRRTVWGAGYTELFFLDEVTALAAGHRPCAECRRTAFKAYLEAVGATRADDVDRALEAERRADKPIARLADLPDGVTLALDGRAITRRRGELLHWSPEGWAGAGAATGAEQGPLLTPPTTVRALRASYAPLWHAAAG